MLAYAGGLVLVAWGAAHIAPTRAIVVSFQPITTDNRRVLVLEWVAEGFTHIFLGALVILITALGAQSGEHVVYRAGAAFLLLLVGLTAATGARTPVVWYRICLVVLSSVAGLLLAASLV
jgi:hypothetical protein